MALSSGPAPLLIENHSLEGWEVIGSGGFGQIYKARHNQWCRDVAIKLLYNDDGNSKSLLREVDMMRRGSSPNVIQVLGVFKGRLPSSVPTQLGLVMELMERGSLASLQMTLRDVQPWPLVFRLAHQVALGINFLHSLSPPLLHLDLKPNNVLLDSDLNAKLTDFGLARFYQSVTRVSKKDSEEEGGTINYMPPEAFDLSYMPTKASDIYSYGILLWSIVTGKQPYANAMSSIVRFRIPQGDRPSLDEIRSIASGRSGLTRLMDLMQKCWKPKPNERPTSFDCTSETEELYKMHKRSIHDVVSEVLKKLDQREEEGLMGGFHLIPTTQDSVQESREEVNVLTGRPPVQEMGHNWPVDEGIKTRLRDPPSSQPTRLCENDRVPSRDYEVKKSSVHPVQSSPSPGTPTKGKTATTSPQGFRENLSLQFYRQSSSPAGGVHIHCSNVIGLQRGDYNHMCITTEALDRRRHPTAPSSVNLPMPHP